MRPTDVEDLPRALGVDTDEVEPAGAAPTRTKPFSGLLFPTPDAARRRISSPSPAAMIDLHLDQIAEAIAVKREEPDYLIELFVSQLHDADAIRYRQEIFLDLENATLLGAVQHFADEMVRVRSHLASVEKMRHRLQQQGWTLDAASIYCSALRGISGGLEVAGVKSRGLQRFGGYVSDYVESAPFVQLERDTLALKESLGSISYTTRIHAGHIEVARYEGEADYSSEVEHTFERFQQGSVKDYRVQYRTWPGMDHIAGQVLDRVARLFPEEFAQLGAWCLRHARFVDSTIRRFEREVQFYLAYLAYIRPLRVTGLRFCCPVILESSKAVSARDTFDLSLAHKLLQERRKVTTNDFELTGHERIFVVSGPNQGGKTTFARTFGQLHHLASVGCPVPGSGVSTYLFDQVFTHFEREEDLQRMSGKLEDDLIRVHQILEQATVESIVILNEIFTSTALNDARFLGTKIMERLIELDLLGVFVTFVDELATLGPAVVSLVSTVVPENPAVRTFKVIRGPADGLAYAFALAEKHNLTYEGLRTRLDPTARLDSTGGHR